MYVSEYPPSLWLWAESGGMLGYCDLLLGQIKLDARGAKVITCLSGLGIRRQRMGQNVVFS